LALSGEASIQLIRRVGANTAPIGQVLIAPAKATGAMAGGEGNGIVEKEKRRPGVRLSKGMLPALVPELTADPEVATVVTDKATRVVDQTSPVPGEETALVHSV
jgi:hypothetical protein